MKISLHAKQRYAERVMNRETALEIAQYVNLHEEKMHDDICKMLEKLETEKAELNKAQEEGEKNYYTYTELIAENEEIIKEYKKIVKSLTEQNQAYEELMKSMKVAAEVANQKVRETVGTLIGKKVF